jgi:hypothetical protein
VRYAEFSSDGRRIVTWGNESTARVWDVGPANRITQDWLPLLIESVCGQVLDEQGILQDTKLDRIATLKEIQARLANLPSDDEWTIWSRWFLADPATRTISPFCSITVPEYIESRIQEHTAESLDEAERLVAGNDELLKRIAHARLTLEPAK